MRTDGPVLGERAPSKVAALFGDQRGAEAAAARLRRELGLGEAQVRVLSPGDPGTSAGMEAGSGEGMTVSPARSWA